MKWHRHDKMIEDPETFDKRRHDRGSYSSYRIVNMGSAFETKTNGLVDISHP